MKKLLDRIIPSRRKAKPSRTAKSAEPYLVDQRFAPDAPESCRWVRDDKLQGRLDAGYYYYPSKLGRIIRKAGDRTLYLMVKPS